MEKSTGREINPENENTGVLSKRDQKDAVTTAVSSSSCTQSFSIRPY